MKILLCIGASVSIYKTFDLARNLQKKGNTVRVILSPNATKLVSVTLFEALSVEVFLEDTGKMEHIYLSRWCDVLVLCPATASTIGKIANGIGGNLILDTFLARKQNLRTIIVPAMNKEMWNNVFVKENIKKLKNIGFEIIEPQLGILACGEEGIGKLASIEEIEEKILIKALPTIKKSVIITAGGTIEKLDDVRYLTNFSTGMQALEIAKAFAGHDVTIVSAKVDVTFPCWCNIINVESANDMLEKVMQNILNCDIFVACAAVADFTFHKQNGKIKKQNIQKLQLVPNADILAEVCKLQNKPQFVVGFAAESDNILENAKEKLKRKKCDLIVANSLVFGKNQTNGYIIFKDEIYEEFCLSKKELAEKIKDICIKS